MTTLCFIDTETTGLDARIHQPYEVSWWLENAEEPVTLDLPHDLAYADQRALEIGQYHERSMRPFHEGNDQYAARRIIRALRGVTLVGSNPAFDAAMLTRLIGAPVWHHRLINVADAAMWVFDWDRPKGLADITSELTDRGHEIPAPDHTAEGDVRTTKAVYEALRIERGLLS
jgi:hypothetical protein